MVSAQEIHLQINAFPEIMLEITWKLLRAEANHRIAILQILIFGFVHKFRSAFISSHWRASLWLFLADEKDLQLKKSIESFTIVYSISNRSYIKVTLANWPLHRIFVTHVFPLMVLLLSNVLLWQLEVCIITLIALCTCWNIIENPMHAMNQILFHSSIICVG